MGAAAGKPVEDLASSAVIRRAEGRLAVAERVILGFERRGSFHDGANVGTNESLLAAVDDIVLLKEMRAFPTASAGARRMEGALHAAMLHLMKEVINLMVWDGSRQEGSHHLGFAVEKLSVSIASRSVSSSLAFLTGDSISTARTGDSTASSGEFSFSTVDELYASGGTILLNGKSLDDLNLICPGRGSSVLHEISLRIIRAGYTEELLGTFTDAPCDVLDRFLSILQLETDQVISYENAEWWTAEEMIRRWILATKLVEKALVTMQMQLHAHSNGAFDRFKNEYLMAIAKRSTSILLRFADGFTSTRSPEKLMYVLEMYEVLGSVVPSLLLLFTGKHKELMSRQVEGVLAKLARAHDSATYVLLSNIYAAAGQWKERDEVRKLMDSKKVKKEAGSSWIQIKNKVHSFIASDRSHPLTDQIYAKLKAMTARLKQEGYCPNTSFVLHDMAEEQKEAMLVMHSERLALAFGLIATPPGTPLQIVKNLRVCGDCHTVMKLVSAVEDREIIMRDCSRFHHFKSGVCSCGDFW